MDTVIRLRSWIRWAREDPEPLPLSPLWSVNPPPCPLTYFFFWLLPGHSVSSIFCLGMPQFWHQRSEVTGPWEPIPLPLADALSLRFTTHAGPCRSAMTQPSFKAHVGYAGASLAGRRVLSLASGSSSPGPPSTWKSCRWRGTHWRRLSALNRSCRHSFLCEIQQ